MARRLARSPAVVARTVLFMPSVAPDSNAVGTSPRRALSELLRRGTQSMRGADRLAAEANRRRRDLLRRNNLDGTLQEIKKLLDEAVLAERKELARALDDDARFGELQLDALPASPAKAVQELETK